MGTGQLLPVPTMSLCDSATIDLSLLTFPSWFPVSIDLSLVLVSRTGTTCQVGFRWTGQASVGNVGAGRVGGLSSNPVRTRKKL